MHLHDNIREIVRSGIPKEELRAVRSLLAHRPAESAGGCWMRRLGPWPPTSMRTWRTTSPRPGATPGTRTRRCWPCWTRAGNRWSSRRAPPVTTKKRGGGSPVGLIIAGRRPRAPQRADRPEGPGPEVPRAADAAPDVGRKGSPRWREGTEPKGQRPRGDPRAKVAGQKRPRRRGDRLARPPGEVRRSSQPKSSVATPLSRAPSAATSSSASG